MPAPPCQVAQESKRSRGGCQVAQESNRAGEGFYITQEGGVPAPPCQVAQESRRGRGGVLYHTRGRGARSHKEGRGGSRGCNGPMKTKMHPN